MGQMVFTASNASWPIPGDWTNASNSIEGIGGGGGGSDGISSDIAGGGGGEYRQAANQTITATNNVTVGAAGTGGTGNNQTAGGASSFKTSTPTTLMLANGGGVSLNTTLGGVGGSGGTGATLNGNGGHGGVGIAANEGGAGGGGAGGPKGTHTGGQGGAVGTAGAGGGGGSGGGAAGVAGSASTTGSNGGNNQAGTGGGVGTTGNSVAGTGGGGGAGSGTVTPGNGGAGSTENGTTYTISWGSSANGSGGGGGGGSSAGASNFIGGAGGKYGGGGGGGGGSASHGGNGGIGVVVVTWTSGVPSSTVIIHELAALNQPDPWSYNYHRGGRQPYEQGKLAALTTSILNNPPFISRERIATITSEIANLNQPDVWPPNFNRGGRQPYEQGKLAALSTSIINTPQPLHRERTATIAEVVATNQPDVWPPVFHRGGRQPYEQGKLAALSTSVINNPPGLSRFFPSLPDDIFPTQPLRRLVPIAVTGQVANAPQALGPILAWQPTDPLPTLPRQLSALSTSVINTPLPNADALTNLMGIVTAWQPPDPFPIPLGLPQKRAPGSGMSVDNPPTLVRIFLSPVDDVFPAQPLPKLVPIVAVAGQVPYASQALIPILAWQPADPLPALPRPLAALSTSIINNPPGPLVNISAVLQWQPPDFNLQARTLLAALPGMSVDNPPTLSRLFLPTADPDLVIQPRSQIAAIIPVAAAFVPSQSAWLASVIQSWALADPAPQTGLKLPPSLIAVRVDNPPFIIQGRFSNIWSAWEPPPPLPQQGPLIVTPGPIIIVSTILHNLPFIVTLGRLKSF